MVELINFILKWDGDGTDYQVIVVGVNLMPIGVKLKVNFLPANGAPGSSINVDIP